VRDVAFVINMSAHEPQDKASARALASGRLRSNDITPHILEIAPFRDIAIGAVVLTPWDEICLICSAVYKVGVEAIASYHT
jgi:hypothetical protein